MNVEEIQTEQHMRNAAPDMYEALKGMVAYAEYAQLWDKTPNDEYHKARAAIDKAEGKT